MTTDTYQNQDLDNLNPLQTPEDKAEYDKHLRLFGISISNDPKIRLLIGLGVIVVLLLIASIFTSASRRTPKAPTRITPTPTVEITPLPTEITNITKLPEELTTKFSQIDSNINSSVNFNPPQIDIEVGF